MAGKKIVVSYDAEEVMLHFFTGEKVKDSIEMGDFVFDIAHDERIIGWEIHNASKFLTAYYGTKISKEYISSIKEGRISNFHSRGLIFVKVVFSSQFNKVKEEKELVSNMPKLVVA